MPYEGMIFRPPSEAESLIIQTTVGCSWNKCTFCSMYRYKDFRIKEYDEIRDDIETAKMMYGDDVRRVFLADGDALVIETDYLLRIIDNLNEAFPNLERVSTYATPHNLLKKGIDELKKLKDRGLDLVYLGVETGDDNLLRSIGKGVRRDEMLEAGLNAKKAGIKLSVTIILGLGGKEGSKMHAEETARLLSDMDPDYVGALTLMVIPSTPLYKMVKSGRLTLLSPIESILECRRIIEDIDVTDCIFRSNHASNYLPLGGRLPHDKDKIIKTIDDIVKKNKTYLLRSEDMRAL